ncbi:MAG: hypothetical protein KJ970_04135 [Candidatus Eisenbacteria bacterium]|uniref:FeoB-associated Cys-rich membrane protein n=1 Tax=Eiseniibacteriota bacterium TaxID=2212470 RepID=A0A948RSA9_UNCEI|nr:hypothetical protein [Candidatus Eisenbacteria bacterium]MBU1950427.1 hypothetical protein [Candidatus Eisenbacteria bacterium]MBU2690093.1 hypothetical protein [Candidatus Eisenbacteria bacterium]
MGETIVVYTIIGVALVLMGMSFFRIFTGKNEECKNGGTGCPFSDSCRESSGRAFPGRSGGK